MSIITQFMEAYKVNANIELETIICCNCGIPFAVPSEYRKELINSHSPFHCPKGHSQHYTGESDAEKIKRLELTARQKQDTINQQSDRIGDLINEKQKVFVKLRTANKKLKRVKNGVCPCCNRSFENLHHHMTKQHPEFLKTDK